MNRFLNRSVAGAAFLTLAGMAMASGPEWGEFMDAGDLPMTAQPTFGVGPLGFVSGNMGMTSLQGGFDIVDMFVINIIDPTMFRATTDPQDGELGDAFAQFNTQLWIFKPTPGDPFQALGFLGNDDHPDVPGSNQSLLTPIPTDGSPPLDEPGIYFLAITRSNHDPRNGVEDIFNQVLPTEISGPDGLGGMFPVDNWAGDKGGAFDGDYKIALRGVTFSDVPAPGALSLFIIAAVGARRRRRT